MYTLEWNSTPNEIEVSKCRLHLFNRLPFIPQENLATVFVSRSCVTMGKRTDCDAKSKRQTLYAIKQTPDEIASGVEPRTSKEKHRFTIMNGLKKIRAPKAGSS